MNIKELKAQSEALFTGRQNLLNLWQQSSDLFYPERGLFTISKSLGTEFADHLMSGYQVLCRRDLGNSMGAMLRRDKWFHLATKDGKIEERDVESRTYLEAMRDRQRALMYDRRTNFTTAVSQADHDYVTYGQAVLSVEVYKYQHLLFRCWHLKDCAWSENALKQIDTCHVRHKVRARDLPNLFKEVDPKVTRMIERGKGFEYVNCEWAVYPIEDGKWMWCQFDRDHDFIMEEIIVTVFPFVIPRWQTVSESQYAFSPAVTVAFPDARLLQAMTLTLLEAGEMAVRPPLLGQQDILRSDVRYVSGGITWADSQYDERMGDALRPLVQDKGGFPAAFKIEDRVMMQIAEAFFLPKLKLPLNGDKTAYEVSELVKEYVRDVIPIFEPTEFQYNAPLCEVAHALCLQNNAFGQYVPRALAGQDVDFKFNSPIRDAHEREKAEQYRMAIGILTEAMQIDPEVPVVMDLKKGFRSALTGLGSPADWQRKEDEVVSILQNAQAVAQQQREVEQMATVAQAAKAAA